MSKQPSTQECCWSLTEGKHHPSCKNYDTSNRTEGRKEFLHMMFVTALEGGIGYWSQCETYHWGKEIAGRIMSEDIDGFYAMLLPAEGEWGVGKAYMPYRGLRDPLSIGDQEPLRVDLDVMERGVNLLVDKVIEATKSEDPNAPFSRKYLRQFVAQWLSDGDDGDSDADVADTVVQLGLFGEVVYG